MTCTAVRHDSLDAYKNHGCRCPESRRIWARYCKAYQWRRAHGLSLLTDASGTRRRIQALYAMGWTGAELGQRLNGITAEAVNQLSRQQRVHVNSAKAVAEVYEQMWNQRGPSEKTRRHAARRGWPTPLELDDDLIDDPTYEPQLHRLTPTIDRRQRREQILTVVAHLTERGVPAHEIARHVGATARSVQRYRKQLRDAS